MREDLTQSLYDQFPDLYWQRTLDQSQSLMCYGFQCGDGWYDIIHNLSTTIKAVLDSHPELNPRDYAAVQVKEKFGGLRFYMSRSNEEIMAAVGEASEASGKTCEQCGKEGSMTSEGWIVVLCATCADERKKGITGQQV